MGKKNVYNLKERNMRKKIIIFKENKIILDL